MQQKNGQLRIVEDGEFALRYGMGFEKGLLTVGDVVLRQKVISENIGGGNGEGRGVEAAAG